MKKQLVLVARYLVGKDVQIDIQDITNGTANTIVQAIHCCMAKRSLDIHKLSRVSLGGGGQGGHLSPLGP